MITMLKEPMNSVPHSISKTERTKRKNHIYTCSSLPDWKNNIQNPKCLKEPIKDFPHSRKYNEIPKHPIANTSFYSNKHMQWLLVVTEEYFHNVSVTFATICTSADMIMCLTPDYWYLSGTNKNSPIQDRIAIVIPFPQFRCAAPQPSLAWVRAAHPRLRLLLSHPRPPPTLASSVRYRTFRNVP
jgi:hypothetical protein